MGHKRVFISIVFSVTIAAFLAAIVPINLPESSTFRVETAGFIGSEEDLSLVEKITVRGALSQALAYRLERVATEEFEIRTAVAVPNPDFSVELTMEGFQDFVSGADFKMRMDEEVRSTFREFGFTPSPDLSESSELRFSALRSTVLARLLLFAIAFFAMFSIAIVFWTLRARLESTQK